MVLLAVYMVLMTDGILHIIKFWTQVTMHVIVTLMHKWSQPVHLLLHAFHCQNKRIMR